jgi:hypothetical protein
MPVLIKVIQGTSGPVLELGAGPFSTPLLHWLCAENGRKLVSYDDVKQYYKMAKRFQSKTHSAEFVKDWNKIDIDKKWDVVFADHPANRRVKDAIRLKDKANYIVLHDTEDRVYGYHRLWKYFKYVYHWKLHRPWTSVISNFNDLEWIKG